MRRGARPRTRIRLRPGAVVRWTPSTAASPKGTATKAVQVANVSDRTHGSSHSRLPNRVTYWRSPQPVGGRRMKLSFENESSTTTTLGASMKTTVAVSTPT